MVTMKMEVGFEGDGRSDKWAVMMVRMMLKLADDGAGRWQLWWSRRWRWWSFKMIVVADLAD